jgi:tRNA G10  N-methylase Trm11
MGTTPLTMAQLGRQAYYCELNPLLQYLIETKTLALRMDEGTRRKAAEALQRLAGDLAGRLRDVSGDTELRLAYEQSFGASIFFEASVFGEVLKARGVIDHLACEDPLAARFLTVAVVASLVPASRLVRRGDLRYKTPEEARRRPVEFVTAVATRMRAMGADLLKVSSLSTRPRLVSEDALHLDRIEPLRVDAVVTSPPYLNGTNYFRNTKLELWFLRCLRTPEDLAALRFKAVTAGINDVTVAKTTREMPPQCAEVVRRLEASAYDVRIPRMVGAYFAEMEKVFRGICRHLAASAKVVIDIGDSSYGNVHVPTDEILAGILNSLGYELRRQVTLRRRLSRGGFPLRQVLLVFDWAKTPVSLVRETQDWPAGTTAWREFKIHLPHQQGDFGKRNWGHPLHSLCSYQGKMKPSLAHHLVKAFVPARGVMLDPFGGVGTIPFEAALQGVVTFSFEISPAALHISRAKLGVFHREECMGVLKALGDYISTREPTAGEHQAAEDIRFNGPLPAYFDARTFREILLARRFFLAHPPETASGSLVFASLLHILHGNRPYALSRRSHPITPFAPTGPAEYRPLLRHLRDKVNRSLEIGRPSGFVGGSVFHQDATMWWPREVERLDAIITSPPFFDSTRFYLANWVRLWFCGWEATDFKTQPLAFVEERQKAGFDVYEGVFRQARERLRPGGVMVLHLGKSRKCDMAKHLSTVAAPWFRVVDLYAENVGHCESHGIRDKGTVTAHQFLVLQ